MSAENSAQPEDAMKQHRAEDALQPVIRRLRMLGISNADDLQAFLTLVKIRHGITRRESIVNSLPSTKHSTILLDGLACSFVKLENGCRQIYIFHYPGDFVAL